MKRCCAITGRSSCAVLILTAGERLKAARVLVVGLGGLGCAAAQYLAAAGVGQLTLLDFDTVSLSNLQRQTLHSDATLGQPKVDSPRGAGAH